MQTYTQRTVAWPELELAEKWHTEALNLEWGQSGEEATVIFMDLGDSHPAVQLSYFMESRVFGLQLSAILTAESITDESTVADVIEALERHGFEASEYHKRGAVTA